MGHQRRPIHYENTRRLFEASGMPLNPFPFSYSIETGRQRLLANNKVVKIGTLLDLLLDLANDRAEVLDVLVDPYR